MDIEAFRRAMMGEEDSGDVLTPDIAKAWLTADVPDRASLVRTYALSRYGSRDPGNAMAFSATAMGQTFMARDRYIREIGFAVPCAEAIEAILGHGPLIEVGAGTGFWSALLASKGADVLACDLPSPDSYAFAVGTYFPVEKCHGAEFVRRYPDRTVLMVWPDFKGEWSAEVARAMRPGQTIILVSEGHGGCVGCDDLFDQLEAEFDDVDDVALPVWPGIHDWMSIHRKKAA